jgi:hypothetical protein
MNRLKRMEYGSVRHCMVSVDRRIFGDGKDAYETITHKRGIGQLVKELARSEKIEIVDWVAMLEWHRDGFPHWHLLIWVKDRGRAGMIGVEKIKAHWPFGVWISESYIESEDHWKSMVGYFDKHGYFEKGKSYQGKLPQWALDRDKRIKRYETMKHRSDMGRRFEEKGKDKDEQKKRVRDTYQVILSKCGSQSRIIVEGDGIREIETVDVSYQDVKKSWDWVYEEGVGLTMEVDKIGLLYFLESTGLNKLLRRIESSWVDKSEKGGVQQLSLRLGGSGLV